jgi:hypothetical protein
LGSGNVAVFGNTNTTTFQWIQQGVDNSPFSNNFYGISTVLRVPTTSAVPEPSTAMVAALGAVAFVAYGWSRHRRDQRRQAAA